MRDFDTGDVVQFKENTHNFWSSFSGMWGVLIKLEKSTDTDFLFTIFFKTTGREFSNIYIADNEAKHLLRILT